MNDEPPRDYARHPEWRMAFDVAAIVKATSLALNLSSEHEWLRFVLIETADNMRNAVLWAATGKTDDESSSRGYRRTELVIAADAARGDAVIASYCLAFMRSQGLIDEGLADPVSERLDQLEDQLHQLAQDLRARGATINARWED